MLRVVTQSRYKTFISYIGGILKGILEIYMALKSNSLVPGPIYTYLEVCSIAVKTSIYHQDKHGESQVVQGSSVMKILVVLVHCLHIHQHCFHLSYLGFLYT